jgi:hypothetical protein
VAPPVEVNIAICPPRKYRSSSHTPLARLAMLDIAKNANVPSQIERITVQAVKDVS